MNKQKAESFLVRMIYPEAGSGIIYLPPNKPELVFLFTARHCIEDAEISNIGFEFQGTEIQCTDDGKQIILKFEGTEDDNDLAVLVLPRTLFFESSLDLIQYEFLDQLFDLKAGVAVGYPDAHDDVKKLRAEFRQDKLQHPACFEVNTTPTEDLTSLHSDGHDNAGGMSGSGFFIETENCTYLAGILIKFSGDYKDFTCVRVNRINELLQTNDFEPIPYSFSNSLGLDQQWFDNHIEKSIADLGDRYTPEINFELPIAKVFEGLARGFTFQAWIQEGFHDFLKVLDKKGRNLKKPESLKLADFFSEQYLLFKDFFRTTDWSVLGDLQLNQLQEKLTKLESDTYGYQRKIWDLRIEEEAKKSPEKQKYSTPAFGTELHEIRQIGEAIRNFQEVIVDDIILLAKTPCLLLHGKAGYGKSHLLGDIAKRKQEQGKPVILVLGNKLQGTTNVWQQIIGELGLNCKTTHLLDTLNSIGKHLGERILFMVDALNEGNGKAFWKDSLAGFLEDFKKYPFIGLVIAVRDTYLDIVVPDSIQSDEKRIKVEHQGFGGSEIEVIKHFCSYFKLEQPRFPILSPEFSNPKLLLLLCRSLRASGKTVFPEGLNGITEIYKNYLASVNSKIALKLDYPEKEKLVQESLKCFAEKMAENGRGEMNYTLVTKIFRNFDSDYGRKIFQELLKEGTLHDDRSYDFEKEEYVEVIRFNYEKFGDFIAARYLLEKHIDPTNPKAAFQEQGGFIEYFKENYYHKLGIIEALAVLLPEMYGIELLEIFPSKFIEEEYYDHQIIGAFINSLLWRKASSIDQDKIEQYCIPWIEERDYTANFTEAILNLALIPEHPYNAEFIHKMLLPKTMAELDRYWSPFIHDIYTNDHHEKLAIHRLLSWVWSDVDLSLLDESPRQLAATILAWFLPSSNKELRDTATLSLVRLLSGHPNTMVHILEKFEKVNDLYIRERLFAVALGVATNSGGHAGIAGLAQCVYDQIFKDGKVPVHILLRDYARNVIEFALANNLEVSVDVEKIRPPYGSKLPSSYPTKEDVQQYKVDYKSEEFQQDKWRIHSQNRIESSVLPGLLGDFNRYVIKSATRNFYDIPLPYPNVFKAFKKNLPRGTKRQFKALKEAIQDKDTFSRRALHDEYAKLWKDRMTQYSEELISSIEIKLSTEQQSVFRTEILPYLKAHNSRNNGERASIDHTPIARWIFTRVFELGWDKEWHGFFDRYSADDGFRRHENKVERIGKKYQWIAFHEIMAMIADNHYVMEWNKRIEPYQGTWQPFLRNIDPTYPCLNSDSEFSKTSQKENWWKRPSYDKWGIEDWLNQVEDLPNPKSIIELKDPNGDSWLDLLTFPQWDKRYEFGVDEMASPYWQMWYHLRAYFIKKRDAKKIDEWLLKQHFMGRWMPEEKERYQIFDKEYYWSPAYNYSEKEWKESSDESSKLRRKFGDSRFKGIVPTEEYQAGGGSYKNQAGSILKPSLYLWEKMELQQGKNTGEYLDKNGKRICFDPSVGSDSHRSFLIRKKELMEFLEAEQLTLCWTLLGEKQTHYRGLDRRISMSEFSGAYSLQADGTIQGALNLKERRNSI